MNLDLAKIDQFLQKLDRASDDTEMRRLFDTYQAEFELGVSADPYSDEYRQQQMKLYERLHGKPYGLDNERSHLDIEAMSVAPFPYCHGSSALVGDQLMGIGFLIKAMDLSKGARVLEFGPGWGNTTLALGKMGMQVLAIDVEQNFVDLINRRAQMECLQERVQARRGSFFSIEELPSTDVDAVLFFECFHHCDDHLRLVAGLDRVIRPGGVVVFAAEPITEDFQLPWGLRMDGQSLWAIRKNGWMELGFHTDYFTQMLKRFGWKSELRVGSDSSLSRVFVCKRRAEWSLRWAASDPGLKHQVGSLKGDAWIVDGDNGFLSYGPYAHLDADRYRATFHLKRLGDAEVVIDVVSAVGSTSHAVYTLKGRWADGAHCLEFSFLKSVADLELRVRVKQNGARVALEAIELSLQ